MFYTSYAKVGILKQDIDFGIVFIFRVDILDKGADNSIIRLDGSGVGRHYVDADPLEIPETGLYVQAHGLLCLAGQPEQKARLVETGGYLFRISLGDAFVQHIFSEVSIKGLNTGLDLNVYAVFGEIAAQGGYPAPVGVITLKEQSVDGFIDAQTAYQGDGVFVEIGEASGVDDLQSAVDAGDTFEYRFVQRKISGLIAGKVQMIVAESAAAPLAA